MAKLIKDTLPMMQVVNKAQAKAARNHGLPLFKGVLYSHKGNLDENLDMYGRPIFDFVNENTVVIGGAVLALEKLFYGNDPDTVSHPNINYMPQTLNTQFGVNDSITYNDFETRIALFGCGTAGSGMQWGSVDDPDFKLFNLGNPAVSNTGFDDSNTWIPFRISTSTSISPDESGHVPTGYFFRMPVNLGTGANSGYAWYLKEIDNVSSVELKSRWQDTVDPSDDGSEVGSILTQESMNRTDLIECYGQCMITITEDDLREFFVAAGKLNNARFNQIGLFTGVKKNISGNYDDYVGVRLFSVVNFNNVSVQEPSTNVYLYRIYSAV